MSKNLCPICNTTSHLDYEMTDVYLFFCESCKHRFSIIKSNCDEVYDDDYYQTKHKNWFDNPDTRLFSIINKHIQESSTKSVLDVGCGNGNLLKYLKLRINKISLTGIDLSNVKGFDGVTIINKSFLNYEWESKFDMITSLATIEHIDDVNKFVTKIHQKLNSDGLFLVMTMNDDSILYRISRLLQKIGLTKSFFRLYDKHHVNHFSHYSLKKILISRGFSIQKVYLHNAPLKSLDIESSNKLEHYFNKLAVILLFFMGRLTRKTYLQSIVARKI